MLSSIFNFNGLRGVAGKTRRVLLYSLCIICIVETASWLLREHMPIYASNFVTMAYLKADNVTKYYLEAKFHYLPVLRPVFIQVGDSSGVHAIQPVALMEHYIGKDNSYLNLGCCADMGYKGYRYVAEYAADVSPSFRYLVFYVTPFAPSSQFGNTGPIVANSIRSTFLNVWKYLMPPSLGWRLPVINAVYYRTLSMDLEANPLNKPPPLDDKRTLSTSTLIDIVTNARGWIERPQNQPAPGMPPPEGKCIFHDHFTVPESGLQKSADMVEELDATADFSKSHGIQMLLVYNPVSCERSDLPETLELEKRISLFSRNHPEVLIPFPFVRTLERKYFVDAYHVNKAGSDIVTRQLGEYLQKMLSRAPSKGGS